MPANVRLGSRNWPHKSKSENYTQKSYRAPNPNICVTRMSADEARCPIDLTALKNIPWFRAKTSNFSWLLTLVCSTLCDPLTSSLVLSTNARFGRSIIMFLI